MAEHDDLVGYAKKRVNEQHDTHAEQAKSGGGRREVPDPHVGTADPFEFNQAGRPGMTIGKVGRS